VLKIVGLINNMTTECTDISSIFTVLEDEYVNHFNVANKAACQSELNQAYPLVQKVLNDLKEGKTMNLAVDVMQLVSIATSV
jgi:aconitase A